MINAEVFDDRVEISNPGGLVSAIPESEFGKRSHSRNPFIFGLFARMQLIFTVMLQRPVESSLKSSLKCSWKIIELISQNIHITIFELADQIGIITRAVDKQIANLKKHTSNAVGFPFAR